MFLKRLGLIILMILTGVFIVYYYFWIKPYDLPIVNNKMSLSEFNLDFSNEQELVRYINHTQESKTLSKKQVENYKQTVSLLNGNQEKTGIEELQSLIIEDPDNMEYLNMYRIHDNSSTKVKDFIEFTKKLPQNSTVRLQKALAYVDLLQDKDLGIAVLGQTSSSSIIELDKILEENPHDWLAHYARGLNNLYWPSGLKRTKNAIKDLSYCLAVVQLFEDKHKSKLWPLTYEAYGDALIKEGNIEMGMKVWKDGYKKYPDKKSLQKRAKADKNEAFKIVKRERGIEIFQRPDPKITDISILWKD